jgi:dienelactone hydrolase
LQRTTVLTVYIEGDGLAWINGSTPSLDPTPLNPLALRLALRDPSGAAVYLARPCQFVTGAQRRGCQRKYWTSHRFAPEVIEASSSAIEQLKQRFAAERLVLVGYSGGGAVAALIAAQRRDVMRLVTVAGNLDHRAWTADLHLSALDGSLNPADAWRRLQSVPQIHFVGGQDRVLGESVVESYRARFAPGPAPTVRVLPTFDHHCCWVERWPDLLGEAGL